MNCVNWVCGTGGWGGPKPGDPDLSNITISAIRGFGGNVISWSYPSVNPHAVAFGIVYRSTVSNFQTAIEIARVAGNRYLDPMPIDSTSRYFYWVRLVSINGSEGNPVGPAEASGQSTIGGILDALSAQINESLLAQALRTKIDRIQLIGDGLLAESTAREEDILALSRTLESMQVAVDDSMAMITTERLTRISTVDSIARELTTIEATFNGKHGILQQEIGVLASDNLVLASAITAARVEADKANAAFRSEREARIQAIEGLENAINITAHSIEQVESEFDGNLAQAKAELGTEIQVIDGKVQAIGARYTVQVDANGLAGGFGVYNDGKTIDAGFEVDKFWIGKGNQKRKPFKVVGGIVYMDQTIIENASIETGKIKNFTSEVADIVNLRVANATIDYAQLRNVVIKTAQIDNLSVTNIKIKDNEVSASKFSNGAIGTVISDTRTTSSSITYQLYMQTAGRIVVMATSNRMTDVTPIGFTNMSIWINDTLAANHATSTVVTNTQYIPLGGDAGGYQAIQTYDMPMMTVVGEGKAVAGTNYITITPGRVGSGSNEFSMAAFGIEKTT